MVMLNEGHTRGVHMTQTGRNRKLTRTAMVRAPTER
jgi:hypothetical protein